MDEGSDVPPAGRDRGAHQETGSLRFAYVTCADRAQAVAIGRALVEERLAACVNLIPGMHAIYRWQGAVEEADEVVLVAKTTAASVAALTDRVRALHSYTCPCVVVLPIVAGNPDYLAWLAGAVGPDAPGTGP
jgi:periplasmic divalent cation tolerance protein